MSAPTGPDLRDIHLPAEPGWWPPAPGWWIVFALLLIAIVFLSVKLLRVARRRRLRQRVLGELDRCIERERGNPASLAAALSQFLRRLALRSAPDAASLNGEPWMAYLDRRSGTQEFSTGIGRVLLDAPYRPHADYDAAALIALVRRFVRTTLDEERARA